MLHALLLALPVLLVAVPQGEREGDGPPRPEIAPEKMGPETRPEIEVELVRVVDGDTLDVRLEGEVVPLRLLSVDTEEKIGGHASLSRTKPETVFGQETVLWAQELFASFDTEPGKGLRIGLAFPEGRRRDVFGRLLCHVLLPDGRDYNLLLVAEGRSPYFDKYGRSRVAHAAFRAAEAGARAARLGIWNPETNRARTPGAPSAVRPYEELLPWWHARAAAIEHFEAQAAGARAAGAPELVSAEDPAGLMRAFEHCREDPGARVTVLAAIGRFFEERDGSLTALLAPGDAGSSLRARIPAALRPELEARLRASRREFRQNYLCVTGRLERERRGYLLSGTRAGEWRTAEPLYPPPDPAPGAH